jgi:transposase
MRRRRKGCRRRGTVCSQKIDTSIQKRVRRVGPDKFGILAVDSSKKRFEVLLTDFYGHVLMKQRTIPNTRSGMNCISMLLKEQQKSHALKEIVVGIERTGRYHRPIRRCLKRHAEVVMIHPFTTKQLRQPVFPGNKTDGTDLLAISRAVMIGYGRVETPLPERWLEWRLIHRAREDLVRKATTFRVQIQEGLEALMPGYAALFSDLWKTPAGLSLAEQYPTAAALSAAGETEILANLRAAHVLARRDTVRRVLAWAADAASPDPAVAVRHRILRQQCDLLRSLEAAIAAYECDLAGYLADTPFVLLLSLPGINVVSAAGYGAELGPISHYLSSKKITGRAGLYSSRYQSDETDRTGPLVGRRNARLRDTLMEIAHNLIRCNPYFRQWAETRRQANRAANQIHVAVAQRFARISFCMLAGRQIFEHPAVQGRDAILVKLTGFAKAHRMAPETTSDVLLRAATQLPAEARSEEREALADILPRKRRRRSASAQSREPQHIGEAPVHVINSLISDRTSKETKNPKSKEAPELVACGAG